MNVGYLGAGKLGLPCALSCEYAGHSVMVSDINPEIASYLKNRCIPYREDGIQPLLNASKIRNVSVADLVSHSDIVFVAIQTPHESPFEGTTRVPEERKDFDYRFLQQGIEQLSAEIDRQQKKCIVAVISTVLPGTMRRCVIPYLSPFSFFVYVPHFAAMTSVVHDFFNPEFVLIGSDNPGSENLQPLLDLYRTIHNKPFVNVSVESAELIKCAYNTAVSWKTVIANTMMEICHKIPGCDVDDVSAALSMATDRLLSPKYLRGGMGDGGGCHPRDNIAMSWLARKLDLSHDTFQDIMKAREDQTEWLADLIESELKTTKMPLVLLGRAFKSGTNIVTGSPAVLLANILKERNIQFVHYDPFVHNGTEYNIELAPPSLYFIATKHTVFQTYQFPKGSVVLDPHRYILEQEGVRLVKIGVGR